MVDIDPVADIGEDTLATVDVVTRPVGELTEGGKEEALAVTPGRRGRIR